MLTPEDIRASLISTEFDDALGALGSVISRASAQWQVFKHQREEYIADVRDQAARNVLEVSSRMQDVLSEANASGNQIKDATDRLKTMVDEIDAWQAEAVAQVEAARNEVRESWKAIDISKEELKKAQDDIRKTRTSIEGEQEALASLASSLTARERSVASREKVLESSSAELVELRSKQNAGA